MFGHILPNTIAPLVVQGTFICASAILVEAILSFLGVGLPPDIPTWGNIMAEGRVQFIEYPHNVFFPGIFLAVTVLAVNILGDGLRDTLDPTHGAAAMSVRGPRGPRPHDRAAAGGDRTEAVSRVSFDVGRGEILCLVGESGSGKSVIAQSVMGLLPNTLPVTGGAIRLDGEDLTRATPGRLRQLRATRMSMIFQEPMTALNPVMRCGEQIDEVLVEHTTLDAAARRAKILDIVREVHLPDPERIVASYPHQLSGGQRQRIMIAMALVLEPALLIADEPTTALDVTTQAQILKLIAELQARHGTGVLFITHDFGVVAEIAHRVAVLRQGELVELGPRDDVLRRPQHEYTRMLIASVPGMTPHERPVDPLAPVVLATRGLSKTYAAGGWFRKRAAVAAAADVSLEVRRGQTLGSRRRVGVGQVDASRAASCASSTRARARS